MANFAHKCLCPEFYSKDTVTGGSASNLGRSQNQNDFGHFETSGPNPIWFGDGSGTANTAYKWTMEKDTVSNTIVNYQSVVFQDDYKEFSTEELRLQDYMDNRLFGENSNANRPKPNIGTKRFNFFQHKEKDAVANMIVHYQSIVMMPQYQGKSQEELRIEDYRQGTVFQGDTSNLVGSGISSFGSFGSTTGTFGSSTGSGFGTIIDFGATTNPSQESSIGFGAKPTGFGTGAFGTRTATSIGSGFGSVDSQGSTDFGQKPLSGSGSTSTSSGFGPTGAIAGSFGSSVGTGFGTTTGFGAAVKSSFLGNSTGFGAKPTGFGNGPFGSGTATSIGSGFGSTAFQESTGTMQIIIPGFGIINRDFGTNSTLGFGDNNADNGNFVTSGFGLPNANIVNTQYPSFDHVIQRLEKAPGVHFGTPNINFSQIPPPNFGTSNAAFGDTCNPNFGSSTTGFGQNNTGFEKFGNPSFTQASIPNINSWNTGVRKTSCSCSATNVFTNPPISGFGTSGAEFGQDSSSNFGFKSTTFGRDPATMLGTMGNGFSKAPLAGFGAPGFGFGSDNVGSSSCNNGFGQTPGFVNANNSHEKSSRPFFNGSNNKFGQACRSCSGSNSSWLGQEPMFKNNGFGQTENNDFGQPENNGFGHMGSNSCGQIGNNEFIQNVNNGFGSYSSGFRQNSQSPSVHLKYSNSPGVNIFGRPTSINNCPHTVQSDALPSSVSYCSNYVSLFEKLKSDLGLAKNFKQTEWGSEHEKSGFSWKNNQKAAPFKAETSWCPQSSTVFPPLDASLKIPKASVAEKPKSETGPTTLFQKPVTVPTTFVSVPDPLSFPGGSPTAFPNFPRVSADDQLETSRELEKKVPGLKVNDTILPKPSCFLSSPSLSKSPPAETCSDSHGVTAQNNSQHIAKNYPNAMNRAGSPTNHSSTNHLLVSSPNDSKENQPRSEQGDTEFKSDIDTLPDEQTFATSSVLSSPSLPSDFVVLSPSITIQPSADTSANVNTSSTSEHIQGDEVKKS